MNYKDKIIRSVAKNTCDEICGRVIRSLRQMKPGTQPGDDSPRENLWDEICVQVKGGPSATWVHFLEIARELIENEVSQLRSETRQAIWMQTGAGCKWCEDDGNSCKETAECDLSEINEYILNKCVLPAAKRWNNKRIEKDLEQDLT